MLGRVVEDGAKVARDGSLEVEWLASHRMMECQAEGVQAHAAARVVLTAILAITHHRVPHVGHVDTYLVFASRLKAELHE